MFSSELKMLIRCAPVVDGCRKADYLVCIDGEAVWQVWQLSTPLASLSRRYGRSLVPTTSDIWRHKTYSITVPSSN